MRFLDLLKLSLRMFKARRMRTLLTILGMSVGIAAIIFLVSLGYGLQNALLDKITTSDALSSLDVTAGGDNGQAKLDNQALNDMRSIPDVVDVTPVLEIGGEGKFEGVRLSVNAVATGGGIDKSGLKMNAGRAFTEGEINKLVITSAIAKVFNKPPEEMIGEPVDITLFSTTSSGSPGAAYTPKDPFVIVGITESEENTIYLSLDSVPDFPFESYTKLKVKCSSTSVIGSVRSTIEGRGYTVSSISETVDEANKVFRAVQIILMVFGTIALIVSAIGMFNTMTIALLERTEEIGIMKAIGASRNSISLMFVMESTLMGFLGAIVGVALGVAEGKLVNIAINLIATRFGGQSVTLFYSPVWFIITVIAFGAIVGFMTGVFPARKASLIDALDALRYK